MKRTTHLDLPDGRRVSYEIRASSNTKTVRLKLAARNGLTVIAPAALSDHQVIELVSGKREWIASRLNQFDEIRHLLIEGQAVKPQAFDLAALSESWRVEYVPTKAKTVAARTTMPSRIVVLGAVQDSAACQAALRRWLSRRAKETLVPWLDHVSNETQLRYRGVTIKNQRTRWGSCTKDGVISLNCKLLFLPRELVRYVLVHELCHTAEHNHTQKFWTMVRQELREAESLHGRMRDAWKLLPAWAQFRSAGAL